MIKNLTNKKIAIDIDDVISSTVPSLLAFFIQKYNIHIKYEEYDNYKLHEQKVFVEKNINMNDTHDIWNEFFDSEYAKQMELVPWSKEMVEKLNSEWFDIILITARWESLRPHTIEWLQNTIPNIEFNNIYFTGNFKWKWSCKSEICLKYNIEYMIEDNAENCIALSKNWIKSYLITRPWNKHYNIVDSNIKRVSGWHEIK